MSLQDKRPKGLSEKKQVFGLFCYKPYEPSHI